MSLCRKSLEDLMTEAIEIGDEVSARKYLEMAKHEYWDTKCWLEDGAKAETVENAINWMKLYRRMLAIFKNNY